MAESKGIAEKSAQECWKLMSMTEKVLLFLLIITLIVLLALFIFIITLLLNGRKVCDSSSCVKASAKLLEAIDFTADPCVDFQKFICGNHVGCNDNNGDEVRSRKDALISAPPEDDDSESLLMVKQFYQACTNSSAIEDSDDTLLDIIHEIGGWPLLLGAKWNEESFNWAYFMTKLRSRGLKSDWLLSFDYYEDGDGKNLLLIGPPDLKPIPDELKLTYPESIINITIKLGSSVAIAWTELKNVTDFEYKLADISESARSELLSNTNKRNVKLTVEMLNEIWPTINLVGVFNSLAKGYAVFTNKTVVVIAVEDYIYRLNELLMQTPRRTLANYFIWKIVDSFLPFFSENIQINDKSAEVDSREDLCFAETDARFHGAIETSYLAKYKGGDMTESLKVMTNYIKGNIVGGEGDTEVTIVGVEGITELQFKSDDIIRMVNEVHNQIENEFYTCLNKTAKSCSRQDYYHHDSGESGIHLDIDENTMYLPTDLLHSDGYNLDQPNFINYGRVGRTIGDEIIEAVKEENMSVDDDFRGVDLAYLGYMKWSHDEGMEKRLPGLNYTTRQLFWMHSSSIYCSAENSTKFDEVTNSRYFRKVFECQ